MTTQRKNINKEQFFTQHETAKELAEIISQQPWYRDVVVTIEPSAGDGAWIDAMHIDLAYDIEPKHPDVLLQDFLFDVDEKPGENNLMKIKKLPDLELKNVIGDPDFKIIRRSDGKILVVGNPPFGRMGKLAKAFMRKCETFADYIAFILPASFAKASVIRQMPKTLHLIYQKDLLEETFRFEREGKKVSTVFQIWERKNEHRLDPDPVHQCEDFEFVRTAEFTPTNAANKFLEQFSEFSTEVKIKMKKSIETIISDNFSQRSAKCPEDADIAICSHGSGVGKVTTDYEKFKKFSSRTHRYIKIKSKIDKETLARRLRKIDYNSVTKYTVGATCISTNEIVVLYKKLIGDQNDNEK
jgi:hypothetical protein